MRLVPDQSGQISRSAAVVFTFNGTLVSGHQGESVAAALLRAGHLHLRDAPNDDAARGMFCAMGLCQECTVINGSTTVEACRTPVSAGLVLRSLKAGQ